MRIYKYIALICSASLLFACAAGNKTTDNTDLEQNSQDNAALEETVENPLGEIPEFTFESLEQQYTSPEETSIYKFYKKEVHYKFRHIEIDEAPEDAIPVIENREYRKILERYTSSPKTFQRWLHRSNKYIYIVKDIFRRNNVPVELSYLPMVESGYNPHALSRAGASGMWQFMRGTGKIYGLDDNYWVNERQCYEKSTIAAAKHFRDLYTYLGDWYLSLAAYNAGYGKVLNAIKRYETKDFFQMANNGYLKRETREYVPKYLAFRELIRNYELHGFDTPIGEPLFYEKVKTDKMLNILVIAKMIDVPYEELMDLNPELKNPLTPPVKEYELKVPYGKADELQKIIETENPRKLLQYKYIDGRKGVSVSSYAKKLGVSTSSLKWHNGFKLSTLLRNEPVFVPDWKFFDKETNIKFASELNRFNPRVYKVKSGDSFYRIARKFGLSVKYLRALNPRIHPKRLRPGMNVVISRDTKRKSKTYYKNRLAQSEKYSKPTVYKDIKTVNAYHKVRRGENLTLIARKYGLSLNQIKALNPKIRPSKLRVGQTIVVKKVVTSTSEKQTTTAGKYHTVKSGENLGLIAKKYGMSLKTLMKLNPKVNAKYLKVGQRLKIAKTTSASARKSVYHKVRRGETLGRIAQRYGTSISAIKKLNPGLRPSKIRIGQVIKIKGTPTSASNTKLIRYKVRSGDSFIRIAKKFGVSPSKIKSWNNRKSNRLYIGEYLKIYR